MVELLEKRVKSRFSQKQINFFGMEKVEQIAQIMQKYLTINQPEWDQSIQDLFQQKKFKDLLDYNFAFTKDIRWYINWMVNFTDFFFFFLM